MSDITIGDYWGSDEKDNGFNSLGTSIAFVHNKKGEKLVHNLSDFALYDADLGKALKGNL